jgi:Ni/Co efflux regulator RcnB
MKTLSKPVKSAEPWQTGPEVAKHYRRDPATIRRWRREGCPSHKKGYKLILYRLSEVDRWLQSREEDAEP